MCFLVKQTGSNVLARIGGKMKSLEDKLQKGIKKLTKLVGVTNTVANLTEKLGVKVINKVDNLCRKNPELKKPV